MTLKGNHIDAFFRSFLHLSIRTAEKEQQQVFVNLLFSNHVYSRNDIYFVRILNWWNQINVQLKVQKISNEYFFCCLFSRKNKGNGIKGRRRKKPQQIWKNNENLNFTWTTMKSFHWKPNINICIATIFHSPTAYDHRFLLFELFNCRFETISMCYLLRAWVWAIGSSFIAFLRFSPVLFTI